MKFSAEDLRTKLKQFESEVGSPKRYVLAFSGGPDSTVLAHALAISQCEHDKALLAVHIDHDLDPDSAAWSTHCESFAEDHGLPFLSVRVQVDLDAGMGLEAAAREARYKALERIVTAGDWLLSAHHREDQAETLLLNLLRGSGPAGIAAMPNLRPFAAGMLVRPLLEYSRQSLLAYADTAGLRCIDDPSNVDARFDRSFVRHKLMPVISVRWRDASGRLSRSADLARDARDLLADLADIDIDTLAGQGTRLSVSGLRKLSPSRQRNVLRRFIQRRGLRPPPAAKLGGILNDVIPARRDAEPRVVWPGAEIRRYHDSLYLTAGLPAVEFVGLPLEEGVELSLGPGMGSLLLASGDRPGLSKAVLARGVVLDVRSGGEKIKPIGHGHTRKLKKLLQEEQIVPWMRERLPLLFCGDRLVAVADLWVASDATDENGISVHWHDRPELK